MTTAIENNDIIDKVQEEISGLSMEELQAQLLKLRVRAKVQTLKKRDYVPTPEQKEAARAKQAAYNARQRALNKALVAQAKALGLWDEVEAEANRVAAGKVS